MKLFVRVFSTVFIFFAITATLLSYAFLRQDPGLSGPAMDGSYVVIAGALGGFLLLATGVILYLIINNHVKAINQLTAGAREMAGGGKRKRIITGVEEELGELARAINEMAEGIMNREEQLQLELVYRKNTEHELRELKEHLEQEVAKKTKQLIFAREKLFRSEKLAFIGKLAGSVAHELRTPLGAIKNSVYYLKMKIKGSAESKVPKYLDFIDTEADIANKIISDVLVYARLREPKHEQVDIPEIIAETMSFIEVPANITVNIRNGDNVPVIFADQVQIGQVFQNIITNAIQAMPGGGRLDITAIQKGREVEIDFTDTGEGIDDEDLDKIFEPLFSTKNTGIGLGLSTCQTIVELYNGKIEVMSEKEKGTTIKVVLPIASGQKE